jgi:hypothetical protein
VLTVSVAKKVLFDYMYEDSPSSNGRANGNGHANGHATRY